MTLKDGKTGMVLKIVKIHESDLKQRMMTMGLIPGTKVTVLRSAPLGDPIAIGVRSYNLALRKADAVKRWLTGSGVLAYADRWKTAHIYDAIQFSRFGAFKYSFTLPLILSPFWQRVEDFVDMGQTSGTLTIENVGNIDSQPYIRITQVTDTDLDITAGGVRFKLPGLGKGNTITINCEDRSEDKPRNISIGYDYPTFAPGYNIITVHAGTAGIEMRYKDRWI